MDMVRVYISPQFHGPDQGDGGIRRVVEAQVRHLPAFGIQPVDSEADADVVAIHAGSYVHTNKPVVAHCHGLYWEEYNWPQWCHDLNLQVINVLRRADVVTAPSNWVGYALARGMNIAAETIYHGIDSDTWAPGDKSEPYVLWNKTRIDPICDPIPVQEAASLLPGVHFISTFDAGQRLANLHTTGRLSFPQAKELVRNATVYLATARETFGIGTLEAMAAGAVVVGFDWGGQSEIIQNGQEGLLVKPGAYGDLAMAIERALDPAEYARMSALARQRLEDFTWERACDSYANAYRTALAHHQGRPRASVIITCYNLAAQLPTAVASVDDPGAEIIIVDDASPDNTADVAHGLAATNPRVTVVTNQDNLYLAGSLDAGIRASTGRYIVPLDADNELAPGALAKMADALDTDPDVDVAYGAMKVVQDEHHVTFMASWPPAVFDYESQMMHRNQIPSTSMYRRKWWERAGGYRRRCRTAEDADFWCRITSLGAQPKKVTNDVTLIYNDRSDSMSHIERDWPWEAWYTWSRVPELTPFGAPARGRRRVPSYEPPGVSVVIPVGPGHAKYLPDALDSLAAQTYQNWRVLVVHDDPPEEWRPTPPWAPVLFTMGGEGPAEARNLGLWHVETPYVLFLDADDYLAPNALELMTRAAQDRGGTAAKGWFYSDWYRQEEGKVYRAPDFDAEHFRTRLTHSVTAMYPAQLLKDLGGFDANLDAWEDWDLALKLIEAGACGVHLPWPLFYYRYNAGQRREQLYADRERHTQVMRTKWSEYMVENKPMACGCQGGRTRFEAPVNIDGQAVAVSADGRTQVIYLGDHAPRTYRGPSSQTEYRFGAGEGRDRHMVKNEDLTMFMTRPDFRINVSGSVDDDVVLEALGPPDRTAEYAQPPPVAGAV